LLASQGCEEEKDCFDPNDPCPGDMVSDDSGCVWDQCAGDFTGTLIPCWMTEVEEGITQIMLAGERGEYIAHIRAGAKYNRGSIWVYNIETEEAQKLDVDTDTTFFLQADGSRLAWIETGGYRIDGDETEKYELAKVFDLDTQQIWEIPNPELNDITLISISGDDVVVTEEIQVVCDDFTFSHRGTIWHYDLSSQEKKLIADSVMGESTVYSGQVSNGRVMFYRQVGYCSGEIIPAELREYNLETEEDQLVESFDSLSKRPILSYVGPGHDLLTTDFKGSWYLALAGGTIRAWNIDTSSSTVVTNCYIGDCHFALGDGYVAFDIYGEDGLTQRQVYAVNLDTDEELKLTNLRPFYDGAMPKSMKGVRLLWGEGRGETNRDDCGNTRDASDRTGLFFIRDFEF
jgi:hypothetical protein